MKKATGVILLTIGIILCICWIYVGYDKGVFSLEYTRDAIALKVEYILSMIIPMGFTACGYDLLTSK